MTDRDHRKQPRRTSIFYLTTLDINAGETPLGKVVDITPEGVKLTGTQTIPPGLLFRVKIELPATIYDRDWLELDIRSLWTRAAVNRNLHETGFEIENPSAEARRIIDVLDRDYVFSAS